MRKHLRRSRLAVVLVAIGLVAGVGTALAGIVLASVYRPHLPSGSFGGLGVVEPGSQAWSNWHLRLSVAFLATTIGASVALSWQVSRTSMRVRSRVVLLMSSWAAVVASLVTVATTRAAEWDQLALRSVTVGGSRISGYWFAAFDDEVQFILVGNTEVSQAEYVPLMLAHLGAPIIGIALLLTAGASLLRPAQNEGWAAG